MIKANKRNFLFEEVKQTAPERNGFDLSHENKQTCRAGKVYPFEILEALPADDFEIQTEQFIRLQAMLSPTMHRVNSYWHWFFVPNRLCWNFWEEFISRGNGKKLPDSQEYTPPEPPQISLLDLIRFSPFLSLPGAALSTSVNQDTADSLNVEHPEVVWKYIDGSFSWTNKDAIICYFRTPRIANALCIPDTLVPLMYIQKGDSSWHSLNDTSLGTLSINDLYHYTDLNRNPGLEHDIEQYLSSIQLSLMPFIASFKIWTEYYRDENLDEDYTDLLDYLKNLTGIVDYSQLNDTEKNYFRRLFLLNYRCWEKDYFTTSTQLPQKAPDVEIPGTGVSGTLSATTTTTISSNGPLSVSWVDSEVTDSSFQPLMQGSGSGNLVSDASAESLVVPKVPLYQSYNSGLKADSTTVINGTTEGHSATTVAQVRRAFALQRWFEKVVRTGTRYIESLKAFFNSDAGDARLQRAEFIGGSSCPIQFSEVVQTSATDDNSDTVQGNLAGYGVAHDTSDLLRYHAPEHGFVIGFFSILARTSYSQGIPRLFSRPTWLDYAWPEFEHVGEQGVKNIEIAAVPSSNIMLRNSIVGQNSGSLYMNSYADPSRGEIFGYQSRYSEYKQIPDRFGSGFASSLDFWSLGRIFDFPPTLSKEFVHASVSDRNFAVVGNGVENSNLSIEADNDRMSEAYDYDTYICDFWINVKKVTSLTLYSEPI